MEYCRLVLELTPGLAVGRKAVKRAVQLEQQVLGVGQSMHGSVIDIPYTSLLKSLGIDWLPAFKWLSSIRPTIERLPSAICAMQFSATKGCRSASLFELP